jgi:hypothetical protein
MPTSTLDTSIPVVNDTLDTSIPVVNDMNLLIAKRKGTRSCTWH